MILELNYNGTIDAITRRVCIGLYNFNLFNVSDNEKDEEEEFMQDAVSELNKEMLENNMKLSSKRFSSPPSPQFSITFKDVEDSIRFFSGTDLAYPVETFISDFEDLATMLGWRDLQCFLFAKKL